MTGTKQHRHCQQAFTLTEVLVAVGILLLLGSLLLVTIPRVQRSARAARTSADMQTLAVALEAYKQDFGDYPRLSFTPTTPASPIGTNFPMQLYGNANFIAGSELLAWALVGPFDAVGQPMPAGSGPHTNGTDWARGDGKDGFGIRVGANARGTVYGPYVEPEKFLRNPWNDPADTNQMARYYPFLQDAFRQPILYFVRNPKPATKAPLDMYNPLENGVAFVRNPADDNALIGARFEAIAARHQINGPYILWSAGFDEMFSVENPTDASAVEKCDDILFAGQQ